MKFFKIFLAALLAVLVSGIISWVVGLFFIVGLMRSMESPIQAKMTPQTIVKIDLAETICEAPAKNPLAGFDYATMTVSPRTHLLKVLQSIEAAKNDDRVKGLYLNFTGSGGVTSSVMEEMRAAIIDFKKSGKFVVAYNEGYSQGSYYLASVADKVYLHPEGSMDWSGMASTSVFFKGLFDKLGIKAEVFRPTVCKYKSAVEPYIRKDMSPENRAQMELIVGDAWKSLVGAIAKSRNFEDVNKLYALADNLDVVLAEDAVTHGFVDALIYEDEMEGKFAEYGVELGADGKFNIVSLGEYMKLNPAVARFGVPAVGIVYADGQIFDGSGIDDNVYSANLVQVLQRVRKDDNIKSVVLRVNSPGGSALASDVIWREVELLRKVKPVIVSMGSAAASGGYYISAGADAIVANELTLTGSIGVFGMMLEGEDLLNKKLGITTDVAKTNSSADFGTGVFGLGTRGFTENERRALTRSVDQVYETFTSRVATGRKLEMERVLDIAQGRVWSGTRAVELGLADANGGLREAIAIAADKVGIADNFRVSEELEVLSPMTSMMQQLNMKFQSLFIEKETLEIKELYKSLKRAAMLEGVQAYCPYSIVMQ